MRTHLLFKVGMKMSKYKQQDIHDFHNGGQRGKNGNYNIRARPVRPQQNIHGRVGNVASRRK